jgi:hypothetical protein
MRRAPPKRRTRPRGCRSRGSASIMTRYASAVRFFDQLRLSRSDELRNHHRPRVPLNDSWARGVGLRLGKRPMLRYLHIPPQKAGPRAHTPTDGWERMVQPDVSPVPGAAINTQTRCVSRWDNMGDSRSHASRWGLACLLHTNTLCCPLLGVVWYGRFETSRSFP